MYITCIFYLDVHVPARVLVCLHLSKFICNTSCTCNSHALHVQYVRVLAGRKTKLFIVCLVDIIMGKVHMYPPRLHGGRLAGPTSHYSYVPLVLRVRPVDN